jgi:hypothetical protein
MIADSSRLLAITSRGLRFFPMLFLAVGLFAIGMAVRDLFFQAADQFVSVERAFGRRHDVSLAASSPALLRESGSEAHSERAGR